MKMTVNGRKDWEIRSAKPGEICTEVIAVSSIGSNRNMRIVLEKIKENRKKAEKAKEESKTDE